MNTATRVQLSIMMFLQYFIWGAWSVTLASYLLAEGFTGAQVSLAYTSTAWAAIISPFFMGMIADRFFDAQRILGALHLLGAVLMFAATFIATPIAFFIVLLLYAACYMPTIALTNSIAFNQMENTEKEFPLVRVLGTIGWIVAGWSIVVVGAALYGETIEPTSIPLQIAAACSLLMGLYSFSLPKTPPRAAGQTVTVREVLGLDALSLLKERSFAVFVGASLLICIPLAFYYNYTNPFLHDAGVANPAGVMTLGQVSEAVFLFLMPFFFIRLGVKYMLLTGMVFWAARYALFAFGYEGDIVWMFYLGVIFHGICFDFFFITGQIYVDNKAPAHLRSSAQGFIALVTYGVGMVIGFFVAGAVVDAYTVEEIRQWRGIWMIPAVMAFIVAVAFAIFFNDKSKAALAPEAVEETPAQEEPPPVQP